MTTEFKITKDFPVPSGKYPVKYPTDSLEIGESFFAPNIKSPNLTLRYYKPKTFITRTTIENGVTGVRVWRIP